MKTSYAALALSLACLCGSAVAQTTGNPYPGTDQSAQSGANPFPTLPLQSETTPYPGLRERNYSSAPPVQDSADSKALYDRCQRRASREAPNDEAMRQGIAQCLNELGARRQQGQ